MAQIRVVSINLLVGKASTKAVRKLLRKLAPDVVACQELYPHHAAVIRSELPYGHLDARQDYHGLGIALRRPATVERLALTHRDGWRAVLHPDDWPGLGRELEILNVHILNPLEFPFLPAIRMRKRMTEEVIAHIKAHRMPRVLIGDMNASPVWPVYRKLASVMQDGAVAAGTAQRTWGPTWWSPRVLRIDHVFLEGVVPIRTWTERIRGSDHSALVADLELP